MECRLKAGAPQKLTESIMTTSWLNEMAATKDYFTLKVALSPCYAGYRAFATALAGNPHSVKDSTLNPYWCWVEAYLSEEYGQAAVSNLGTWRLLPPVRIIEIHK